MAREAPYLEVAEDLRARIQSGEWSVGDRMPSRAQLAEEYGVGRNVTQRAVGRLIVEGLLEGRAGSGTYVRRPRERRRMIRSLQPEHHGLRETGGVDESGVPTVLMVGDAYDRLATPEWESHTHARIPAPAHIARRLGIDEGESVVWTSYELHLDGKPVQLLESWEPVEITGRTPVVLPALGPLAGRGVVQRMQSIGLRVTSAVEVPRPARATLAEATLLRIAPGDLLTHIERTHYSDTGIAVETADITVPDVRWEIAYEIGVPQQ